MKRGKSRLVSIVTARKILVPYLSMTSLCPDHNLWTILHSAASAPDKLMWSKRHKVVERCLLMATDPGDLVLDPTCGSGTTAYVAEQWGRRWITIDTSRVSLALARARIMGARYPFYLLADSKDGVRRRPRSAARPPGRRRDQALRREHPPRLRLPARAPHHAQVDRQQREIDVIWERRSFRCGEADEPLRGSAQHGKQDTAEWDENGRSRARPR